MEIATSATATSGKSEIMNVVTNNITMKAALIFPFFDKFLRTCFPSISELLDA